MKAYPRVEIQLRDTPLEAFQLLMKYTYCGEMKIEDSDLQVRIAAAHIRGHNCSDNRVSGIPSFHSDMHS